MQEMYVMNDNSNYLLTPDEYLLRWAELHPHRVYLRQIQQGEFIEWTFLDVKESALKLVSALHSLGIKPGDRVAIMAKNCAEWFVTDLALMLGDFVSVPIFPTADQKTINQCITHSDCRAIFVGKLDDPSACEQVLSQHDDLVSIAFPYPTPICQHTFTELIQSHSETELRVEHSNHDTMSILYTSGTSGTPKGAMISYGAFSWTVNQIVNLLSVNEDDRLFSYLPLSHITERVYIFGSSITLGVNTAFPESLDTFIDDVKLQRPTLFLSVPRLWQRFQQRILDKLPQKKLDFLLSIPFVDSWIKNKIAKNLGLDQARILGCGSAPISPAILRWYERIDMPIVEAWGMTESCAFGAINYPYRSDKVGTVGREAAGTVLSNDAKSSEILLRSEGLFSGYYKQPDLSQKAFDAEGRLRTGDIGLIDDEGFLQLTGRVIDTFKTAKGKFVSPVPIEKEIEARCKCEMLCLIGLGLVGPVLLLVPYPFTKLDRHRYEKSLTKAVNSINPTLQSHEKIRGIFIVNEPWTIENGVLTPTLKIRRFELEKRFHDLVKEWPAGKLIVWQE
jgi:long-subunit acyl-CoA synthetase (AMP-forming)